MEQLVPVRSPRTQAANICHSGSSRDRHRRTPCACTSRLRRGGVEGTTALTRVGEAVQVTESAMRARECEFITDLPVRSPSPTDVDALRALRNDAGAAGSNLVPLVMASRTSIERAEGYLCVD
jgi:hypothetical protein